MGLPHINQYQRIWFYEVHFLMLLQVWNDKPLLRKTVCQVSVTDETGLYSVVGDKAVNCLKIQRVHNIQSVTDFA